MIVLVLTFFEFHLIILILYVEFDAKPFYTGESILYL